MSGRLRDERGSSLIIALVFLTVFGVLISAVLSFTEAGLLISRQARIGAESAYASDSAVDAAINYYANDPEATIECPAFDLTEEAEVPTDPPTVVASVAAECASEAGGGSSDRDVVGGALLAYGYDPGEGIQVAGSTDMVVGGDVHSNSGILAPEPDGLQVFGDVSAVGSCVGVVIPRPGAQPTCDDITSERPVPLAHPALLPPVPDLATPTALPTCDGPARTVTFTPGFYNDAGALNALTSSGACGGRVLHFQPGSYYFDFRAVESPPTWSIALPADTTMVGGQPATDFETAPAGALPEGSCVADGPAGVQFVFGGESRLSVQSGAVELCGVEEEPVVYGLAAPPPTDHQATTARAGSGSAFVSLPDEAVEIDGEAATVSLSEEAPQASVVLDFPGLGVPAGARLDTVALRVSHRQEGDFGALALSLTATPNMSTPPPDPPALTVLDQAFDKSTDLHEDQIDLFGLGLDTVEEVNAGMTVELQATSSGGAVIEHLDGIELALAYTEAPAQPLVPDHQATSATSTAPEPPDPARSTFGTPENALAIEGGAAPLTADASLSDPVTAASIDLAFPPAPLPAGARVETVELRASHRESDPAGLSLSAVVAPDSAGPVTVPDREFSMGVDLHEDRIDLVGLGFEPEDVRAGMTVSVTASRLGPGPVTEFLDGIALAITYTTVVIEDPAPDHQATTAISGPQAPPAEDFFSPADAAKAIDGAGATARLTGTFTNASIQLVYPSIPVPPGAVLEGATLRVAHAETATELSTFDLSAVVTPGAPSSIPTTIAPAAFTDRTVLGEDRIDLGALGVDPDDLRPGFTVELTANRAPDGAEVTVDVDGIELDFTYTLPPAPRFRAPPESSCLRQVPYVPGDPATCPLLDVGEDARAAVHGPVYAPLTAVDLSVVGESVGLDGGVAARTVHLDTGTGPAPSTLPCAIQGSSSPLSRRTVTLATEAPPDAPEDSYVRVEASVVFTDQQDPDLPCSPITTATKVQDWIVGGPGS